MANSPFLFEQKLWDETRITLFEQSVQTPESLSKKLVSLGPGYIKESIFELFEDNIRNYYPVLPLGFDDEPKNLRHLKFLNGQVWRWVRPIIGVDHADKNHIRLEQRSFPCGPSSIDTIANTAFYIGLLHFYTHTKKPIEELMSFQTISENFYNCAKLGTKAEVIWIRLELMFKNFYMIPF